MQVSNIENIKPIKTVDNVLRKGIKFKGEVKEINLAKGEATLVLRGGKELKAKIEVDISKLIRGRSYSFEVLNYEGGELKLTIGNLNTPINKISNSLELFMKENKIPLKFKNILKFMLKYEVPLTKENINKFSNFLNLAEKPVEDFEKSLETLDNYIKNKVSDDLYKNIDFKNELKECFKELSKFSKDNMASLLENNIVVDKENIKSFNNLFKGEGSIFDIVKNIEKAGFNEEIFGAVFHGEDEGVNYSYTINSDNKVETSEYIFEEKELLNHLSSKEDLESKVQFTNNENTNKKEVTGSGFVNNKLNEEVVKENYISKDMNYREVIEGILNYKEGENKSSSVDFSKLLLKDESFNILESLGYNKEDIFLGKISKENIEEKLSEFLDKKIDISNKEFEDIKERIKQLKNIPKGNIPNENKLLENILKKGIYEENKLLENKFLFTNANDIVGEIKNKEEEMKNIIKNLIKEASSSSNKSEAISNLIKNNINDFKLFNDFSNEYYYLDVPVNINKEEYGVRLVIKDERAEGKKVNKNNVKLALTVKTINIGEVDALLSFVDKKLNVEIKIQKENIEYIRENLGKLEKSLELLGFMPYIFVSEKVHEKSDISTYRDFFNNSKNSILDRLI